MVVGRERDLFHRLEALWRAFDNETVHVEFHVIVVHFEKVSRDHLRLGADFAARHGRGRARNGRGPRAVGAKTIRRRIGVAFLDGDRVRR